MRCDEKTSAYSNEMFETMPDDLRTAFNSAVEASGMSKEQFVAEALWNEGARGSCRHRTQTRTTSCGSMFIGDCPECGSERTVSCDELRGDRRPHGRALRDCGLIWCLECGMILAAGKSAATGMICEGCSEEKDEYGDCGMLPADCPSSSTGRPRRRPTC